VEAGAEGDAGDAADDEAAAVHQQVELAKAATVQSTIHYTLCLYTIGTGAVHYRLYTMLIHYRHRYGPL
jgi:hypothetical protein